MKSKIVKLFAIASLVLGTVSCHYLDVSDELAGGLTDIADVFENVNKTQRWYAQVYDNVPDYSRMWSAAGMGNIWSFYTDEMYSRIANNTGKYQDFNSGNTNSDRWGTLYESIRQANIFLERVKPIKPAAGMSDTGAEFLTEDDVVSMKANVRFLRALYYFYLMELYGPVPIVTKSLTYGVDELDIPRAPLDTVINFIDSELLGCMDDLIPEPNHEEMQASVRALPTKGVALALRAKLWAYAASPLYNGQFTESLSVKNKDGLRLFPDEDPAKLQKAADACKAFIDYAEGRYELYRNAKNGKDAHLNVYELFQTYNKEIIWATAKTQWGKLGDQNFESMVTPRSEPKGILGMHILQELVDDFYMEDGLPIRATSFLPASPIYSEEGTGTLKDMGNLKGNNNVFNMYIGREPRFYNTVTFSGKKWHMSNQEVQFYKDGNADNSVNDGAPITGYGLYKRACREVHGTIKKDGKITTSKFRPSIIFRLADFYLLYAETLNEVDPGNPDVLKYVNEVRDRAGLKKLEELNPDIAGNKDLQREAIRRERRIELATEGQRYFDVRRWMIADKEEGRQGGDFHGMDVGGNKQTFYKRTKVHTRSFTRKNYWYPVPLTEMRKSKVLVQNPGW